MVVLYARVIEIKAVCSGKILGFRMIASTNKPTIGNALTWQGDYLEPGQAEAKGFEKHLKGFPYNADQIIWIL